MNTTHRIALELDQHQGIDMEEFAQRLRETRSARGLTQTRLAELLEVSPRVYNRWERGAAIPRLDTLVKVAEILEVSLDELVGRKEPDDDVLKIRNPELHSLYKEIDRLSDEDQQALVVLIDSLVKRSEFQRMMAG
jgi:transcriptional regulator with XRE-family HTH domain